MEPTLCPYCPTVSRAALKAAWPAGQGGNHVSLLCTVRPPDEESSTQERHGPAGAYPKEGHKNAPRDDRLRAGPVHPGEGSRET